MVEEKTEGTYTGEPSINDNVNDNAANDLGVEKEQLAELVNPVPADFYVAEFGGLILNEDTKGYVHKSKSGGNKVIANFRLMATANPAYSGRFLPALHVAVSQKLFAQMDKALDLITGRAIDPEKVEGAIRKVVRLKVEVDDVYNPENPRNKITAIYPFVEKKE